MNIEYVYKECTAGEIKLGDFIQSFNIKTNEYEPNEVNEIIHSTIEHEDQVKITTGSVELTTSKSTKIFTKSGYKQASELTDSDLVLVNNDWQCKTISTDSLPTSFIDFNIGNNHNFVASNSSGEKILIHNSGALAIYFDWWHLDVIDILSLKSNGGTDENRARGLQYAIKLNRLLERAFMKDEEVTLFDPKDVPELLGKHGEEFERLYEMYCNKTSIRKKKIKARELMAKVFKERSETGNIYLFHSENVNEQSMLNRYIGSSNLCTEIVLPSRASHALNEELVTMEEGDHRIIKRYTAGEIALCNLASINLEKWFYKNDEERMDLVRTVVRALDNTVDVANYPVKEGKHSNMMYRYLGIGVLNYTNYLALNELVIDTQEAAEETDRLFDDLSYKIISASVELAIEKGKFPKFYETEWSKGILPIHKANENAHKLTEYQPDMDKWNELAERVKTFGIRNAQLMAIAPTACQTKESVIKTDVGNESLEDLMNRQGIDHTNIENLGKQQWINFKTPIFVPTRFGDKKSTRIWYNGKVPTKKITFADGNTYEFSLNHKLLAKLSDGSEKWVYVNDLTIDMEIVSI